MLGLTDAIASLCSLEEPDSPTANTARFPPQALRCLRHPIPAPMLMLSAHMPSANTPAPNSHLCSEHRQQITSADTPSLTITIGRPSQSPYTPHRCWCCPSVSTTRTSGAESLGKRVNFRLAQLQGHRAAGWLLSTARLLKNRCIDPKLQRLVCVQPRGYAFSDGPSRRLCLAAHAYHRIF
eukprot:2769479-Prymnesium_polylepis.2